MASPHFDMFQLPLFQMPIAPVDSTVPPRSPSASVSASSSSGGRRIPNKRKRQREAEEASPPPASTSGDFILESRDNDDADRQSENIIRTFLPRQRPAAAAPAVAPAERRVHVIFADGGGGAERPAPRDEEEEEETGCPVCWEEQPYLIQPQQAGGGNSGILERVTDFRKVIFRFEQLMNGKRSDAVIFQAMLALRKKYIESILDAYGYKYKKWTLAILQKHYNPVNGHTFDPIRDITYEIADMRKMKHHIMQFGMFIPSLAVGEPPLFNMKAVDVRLRVSKQLIDLTSKLNALQKQKMDDGGAESRMIIQAVADTTTSGRHIAAAPPGNAVSATIYEVGGL